MKTVYCDSNFWVRLFVEFPDAESDRARSELESVRDGNELRLPLTWLQDRKSTRLNSSHRL